MLLDTLGNSVQAEYWKDIFDQVYADAGDVDYWDYQWTFAVWAHNGLAVIPEVNLIQNIGFGEDATHTKGVNHYRAGLPCTEMAFQLDHPPVVAQDARWDVKTNKIPFEQLLRWKRRRRSFYRRLHRNITAALRRPVQ